MPHSQTLRASMGATLTLSLIAVAGCADQSADEATEDAAEPPTVTMTDNDWQFTEIDGEATVAEAMPTLQFAEDGRIGGTSGCNRYFSSFEMDGDKVTIGNAGASMMACPEPLMQQERRFFVALAAVERYTINANGELQLTDADGQPRLLAVPYFEQPPEIMDQASETVHKFDCGDGGMIGVRYVGPDTVEVTQADQRYILPRERSASGTKFSKDGVTFWWKGDEAMLETEAGKLSCTRLAEVE